MVLLLLLLVVVGGQPRRRLVELDVVVGELVDELSNFAVLSSTATSSAIIKGV